MGARDSETPVNPQFADMLCSLAEQHGIPRAELLAGTDLTPEKLANETAVIRPSHLQILSRRMLDRIGEPTLGIEHGLMLSVRSFGFLGYAAMSCPTLGDALSLFEAYQRPYVLTEISAHVHDGVVTLQLHERTPWGDLRSLALDAAIVTVHKVLGQLAGDLGPVEVRMASPELPHHGLLRDLVPGPVRFDAPVTQYCFRETVLARRLAAPDPTLLRLAVGQCERERQAVCDRASLVGRVRGAVLASLADGAPLEDVAQGLNTTARTLRRRLDALGSSYASIVDEVRRDLAVQHLTASDRSVDDIAELLGYGEASSFRRAFRRWTGGSPAEFRRRAPPPRPGRR